MSLDRMPPKYWITLGNWKNLLSNLVEFEEVYIYKKKKCIIYEHILNT